MDRIDFLKLGSEIHGKVKLQVLDFIENNKSESILILEIIFIVNC